MPYFYEFFAGGGMVRAALNEEPGWDCLLANDNDPKKQAIYKSNWGQGELIADSIESLSAQDLPYRPDLSWASFPCQDLSLAGVGGGLGAHRSGTFWPFWKLMTQLDSEGRAPRIVTLENVYGALRSHKGQDFASIAKAFTDSGYRFGALVVDAVDFVPQSRPRLFVIGVHPEVPVPGHLLQDGPTEPYHPQAVLDGYNNIPEEARGLWLWWHLPQPAFREADLIDLIEPDPEDVEWHPRDHTQRLLSMMTPANLAKVEQAKNAARPMVGGVYRRTRQGQQRAEVRFDGVSGCLRTPSGGSSKQTLLFVDGDDIRSRLLSGREAARLMGLPEWYQLPDRYTDTYHMAGDGVVVPVVRHITRSIFNPILNACEQDLFTHGVPRADETVEGA